MYNKKISIVVLALSMAFILACGIGVVRGSGKVVTETRDVSGFDHVEIHGGGNLYLVQGDSETLEIEAEENIMPYLTSRVINDTLILEFDDSDRKNFITTRPINYYLTMEDIHGLVISGGGDIETQKITTSDLKIDISGGGNLDIDHMEADTLQAHISGGGDIRIANGVVKDQDIDVSGGGKYDAPNLQSQIVTASISGGGDLTVWAEESLDVNVSGGGSVYYYGNPTVNSSISGGGDVIQRDK
jgi:Putative auto-transporter adhesin, head GIN domain